MIGPSRPIIGRTTLYKAMKLRSGKVICVDADHLQQTSKVVTEQDYDFTKSLGWFDSPQEAMDAFERDEEERGELAAVRAADDQHMSPKALAESEAFESKTVGHVLEIPRKPGRPRKVTP